MGVHPGSFEQRVRKRLKRREIYFALLKESERERQEWPPARQSLGVKKSEGNETPVERFPHVGNPDGYQKKGVSGEAKGIVVKTKSMAPRANRSGCSG